MQVRRQRALCGPQRRRTSPDEKGVVRCRRRRRRCRRRRCDVDVVLRNDIDRNGLDRHQVERTRSGENEARPEDHNVADDRYDKARAHEHRADFRDSRGGLSDIRGTLCAKFAMLTGSPRTNPHIVGYLSQHFLRFVNRDHQRHGLQTTNVRDA